MQEQKKLLEFDQKASDLEVREIPDKEAEIAVTEEK